jgi:ABC-type lipoprotein release transport system permease subunit
VNKNITLLTLLYPNTVGVKAVNHFMKAEGRRQKAEGNPRLKTWIETRMPYFIALRISKYIFFLSGLYTHN